MLSVVYTDVVNGVIMLTGVGLALVYMIQLVGGPSALISAADDAGKWSGAAHKQPLAACIDLTRVSGRLTVLAFVALGHWEDESLTASGGR